MCKLQFNHLEMSLLFSVFDLWNVMQWDKMFKVIDKLKSELN